MSNDVVVGADARIEASKYRMRSLLWFLGFSPEPWLDLYELRGAWAEGLRARRYGGESLRVELIGRRA